MQFVIVPSPIITLPLFVVKKMMQQPPKHGGVKIYEVKTDRFSILPHMFFNM